MQDSSSAVAASPDVIVVEDNEASRGCIVRFLRQHLKAASIEGVGTVAQARAALWAGVRGVVLDVNLPDGDGFELASAVQYAAPHACALLVTGCSDAWVANRAVELQTPLARKPELTAPLRRFVQRVVTNHAARDPGVRVDLRGAVSELAVDVLARSAGLTPQGRHVLELLSRGIARERLAEHLGLAETTVRSHIREVLARTGATRADALGWRLLRICDDLVEAGYGADGGGAREVSPGRGAGEPAAPPHG